MKPTEIWASKLAESLLGGSPDDEIIDHVARQILDACPWQPKWIRFYDYHEMRLSENLSLRTRVSEIDNGYYYRGDKIDDLDAAQLAAEEELMRRINNETEHD